MEDPDSDSSDSIAHKQMPPFIQSPLEELGLFDRFRAWVFGEQSESNIQTEKSVDEVLQQVGVKMALEIQGLNNKDAEDIMTPRPKVWSLDANTPLKEAIEYINITQHTLYPVLSEGEAIGVVDIRNLIKEVSKGKLNGNPTSALAKPISVVPETKGALELLLELIIAERSMAIVVDEYGQMVGVVTLADFMREITGNKFTKNDLINQNYPLGDGRLSLSGQILIEEFNRDYQEVLPNKDYNTLGGFVFGQLGHAPSVGEEVLYNNCRFIVVAVEGALINRLLLERKPENQQE